jgi:hypothetical protein
VKPGVKWAPNRLSTEANIWKKNRHPIMGIRKLFINTLGLGGFILF